MRTSGPAGESSRLANNTAACESDSVALSPAAQEHLDAAAQPRTELIERVRAEIRAGTYLTDDKLNATAERLAKVLRQE